MDGKAAAGASKPGGREAPGSDLLQGEIPDQVQLQEEKGRVQRHPPEL